MVPFWRGNDAEAKKIEENKKYGDPRPWEGTLQNTVILYAASP
jgi:hypothetical protein